ncbi:hypothetical protein F5884DRAFT_808513 [Xylogone sp. PMI_703]|nr:hypothetical protein F5884DRAFT_808513 [Xylogone sp. PMI_703]
MCRDRQGAGGAVSAVLPRALGYGGCGCAEWAGGVWGVWRRRGTRILWERFKVLRKGMDSLLLFVVKRALKSLKSLKSLRSLKSLKSGYWSGESASQSPLSVRSNLERSQANVVTSESSFPSVPPSSSISSKDLPSMGCSSKYSIIKLSYSDKSLHLPTELGVGHRQSMAKTGVPTSAESSPLGGREGQTFKRKRDDSQE